MQSNPITAIPAEQPASPVQVCKHRGCTASLTRNDNKTGYCGLHYGDTKRKPDLSGEELKECRADDRWEEHHGETDTVACRICGELWACLGGHGRTNHFRDDHEMTVPAYRQLCKDKGWGTPLIRSLKSQRSIERWRDENPEALKESWDTAKAKAKLRRATDPEFRKHEHEQVRNNQQNKLSEADKAERVRCEECPERGWYLAFGRHLWAVHHMRVPKYKVLHPDAPTVAAGPRKKQSEHSKGLWAERKAKIKAGWRPADWLDKTVDWRIIGNELLSQDYISNEELGERLDSARIIGKCPYGETWKAALSDPNKKSKSATNLVWEIRKWVRKPGRFQGKIAS